MFCLNFTSNDIILFVYTSIGRFKVLHFNLFHLFLVLAYRYCISHSNVCVFLMDFTVLPCIFSISICKALRDFCIKRYISIIIII